jgi:hypothetical protein
VVAVGVMAVAVCVFFIVAFVTSVSACFVPAAIFEIVAVVCAAPVIFAEAAFFDLVLLWNFRRLSCDSFLAICQAYSVLR